MRRSTIVNLNTRKFVKILKQDYLTVIFAVIFLIGIIVGVIAVGRNSVAGTVAQQQFSAYVESRKDAGVFRIFISAFFDVLPLGLITFLCGTSLVGIALCPLAVCYKGFSYGIISGYLYKIFLLKGIAFNALVLIPTTLVSSIALIICGKLAFNFSLILARASIPKGQSVNLYNSFQLYCKRFAVSLLLLALSSMIDAIMSVAFLHFFNF